MKLGSARRRIWVGILIVLVLPVLVPLITLQGARERILSALDAGLGRRVSASTIRLQLFPYPGVELDNVRLAEDPAFGNEDMVVAADATAAVRVLPLLAGRLEFARLALDDASINLVRNDAGRWNVAALLDRVGGPGAAGSRGGAARRFPYVEWSNSRVNFKFHQTKTRFYLDHVQGSLVHEGGGWRLQAEFEPERTDLELSDPGTIRLDGLWPDLTSAVGGGRFSQRPFTLQLQLSDSYLAASSALIAGHDAGVHGIVSAQVQVRSVAGGAPRFAISGTVEARDLRRWDLLPPSTVIAGAFAGVYDPALDQFKLTAAGDTGWKHLRVGGVIQGLFTRPAARLQVAVQRLPAEALLPLAQGLKSGLPANLQATGMASGGGTITWTPARDGGGNWSGRGTLSVAGLGLQSGGRALAIPKMQLLWGEGRLRVPTTAAQLSVNGAVRPLRLAAEGTRAGFRIQLDSAQWTSGAGVALGRLIGLSVPWPVNIAGTAKVTLALSGVWKQFRDADWSGEERLRQARFEARGSSPVPLSAVDVQVAGGRPLRVLFRAAAPVPVRGTVEAAGPGTPVRFALEATRADAGSIWKWLQPPPADLMQRVFGGEQFWLQSLHASGAIAIRQFDWGGVAAGVRLHLDVAPTGWSAADMRVRLAGGRFLGSAQLHQLGWQVAGEVPVRQPIALQALLAHTPYRGALSGRMAGSLRLRQPDDGAGLDTIAGGGDFAIRGGWLRTNTGRVRFERLSGRYRLRRGGLSLTRVVWLADGLRWQGLGTVALASPARFRLLLRRGSRSLALRGRLTGGR